MTQSHTLLAALLGIALVGCSASQVQTAPSPSAAPVSAEVTVRPVYSSPEAIARARADSAQLPYVAADVSFMSGMISHHAQAIAMARLTPDRTKSNSLRILSERIINAQVDEIVLMQQWLSDRQKPVPKPNPNGMRMVMNGAEHDMLMPGMLTPEQMGQLARAKGKDYDRLFLTFMIQHHNGAVAMVKELFGTYGAGQNHTVFKLASDVNVDQTTEIARMEKMLATLTP